MSSPTLDQESKVAGLSKTYILYDHKTYDIKICEIDSEIAIYFSEHHSWTPKVPDLVFHAGADKNGPVLGVGRFAWVGANTVGLGDPDSDPSSVVWEKLVGTSKWTHSEYKFEFPFGPDQKRTTFIWRRVKTKAFSDQGDMELVIEGKEDDVLADYIGFGVLESLKKRAKVTIKNGQGEKWELMVWLTGLSLVELSRRRARARRYKAG
jgi:hypothetical protein